ncbi:triphosphoribosyl-dephospho-CoA synthase CitG [Clostridium rectalis]|uniref:triphosphoribosyl-dephospho-CoA synthase CitG n=1 Tax=Clostridium rectalis TaxID=2040295 RepID=UPI000F63416B|nr:triphosphoribosyl-dephospho-CoA synthase CitG [Clostridium rectalis]
MKKLYEISDIAFDISSFAVQSMLYEVACNPSPGLVSIVSMGAHNDMDHYTFIDSTCSLLKYLTLCCEKGFSNKTPKEILKDARSLGIDAENRMFKKTNGVNTHKGMLFLMGVVCIATAKAIHDKKDFKHIKSIIKDMCEGLVEKELCILKDKLNTFNSLEEMCKEIKLSYGEKLYLLYGIEGIRGEVEKGLPIIFDFALNFYKENNDLKQNDRLVQTLLGIMQHSEDSNILHKHSVKTLNEMQEKSKNILSIGGVRTKKGRNEINNFDKEFSLRKISPGGSADLLAITVFFYLVEEYMETLN